MSVSLIELSADCPLRIEVSGDVPDRDQGVERCWQSASEANRRLFDGSILALWSVDASSSALFTRRDRFSHIVCRAPRRELGTVILSVTGVIEAVDGGRECVLLARRGDRTRSYPGMWEFAPAGGLGVPETDGFFGLGHVLDTLHAELSEEVGVMQRVEGARAVAVAMDRGARSADIIVRARLDGPAPPLRVPAEHAWECMEACWAPIAGLSGFFDRAEGGVIEPTLAVARWLGWA